VSCGKRLEFVGEILPNDIVNTPTVVFPAAAWDEAIGKITEVCL